MKLTDEIPSICCVYKITNTISNLILIGSTTNLNKRINHYRNDIHKDNPLKHYNRRFLQDIIDNGIKSFTVDIIEEYNNDITNTELKNNETKYILQYNSINPKIGYNLRLDIDGKYICNNSTRILKSEQLKEQWSNGIRDKHSNIMKNYWKNNTNRKIQQSKVMSKALTKYVSNIYLNNELIKEHIYFAELSKLGFKSALKYFADEDKKLNKDNKTIIKKYAKIVYCKGYKIERIITNFLKI